jgi:hypothetical protein
LRSLGWDLIMLAGQWKSAVVASIVYASSNRALFRRITEFYQENHGTTP